MLALVLPTHTEPVPPTVNACNWQTSVARATSPFQQSYNTLAETASPVPHGFSV